VGPYTLKSGEGWTYHYGIDFTVKAGELHPGRGAAFTEYTTRKGEEPPDHTHPTEDEIFYVLTGTLTFRCGGQSFEVGEGGFIYLPQGIEHGYTIRSEEPVRLIVVTFPTRAAAGEGWGGFIADVEGQGELVAGAEKRNDTAEADLIG
jgi:quercetin dioxygenase-like cupin family protein